MDKNKRYTLEEWERYYNKAADSNAEFLHGNPYSKKKNKSQKK